MISHATIYLVSSALLGLGAVGLLVATRRLEPSIRRYGYATVLACGAMSVTYLLMRAEIGTVTTNEESVVRFVGYTVAWAGISYVLGAVADAGPKRTVAVFACSMGTLWATFASWILSGTAGSIASLVIVASFVGLVSLLVGPVAQSAAGVDERRTLLYRKLEYLVLLAWAGLIVLGIVSEQNLALTDSFVGQIGATYVDLVLLLGFGGLVLRNVAALEKTAASTTVFPFFGGGSGGDGDESETANRNPGEAAD
ncbi:rhodopsin [Halobiforma lacisalsi AJ5]|uniref:Rhodopsin n=1 Tax=Natronobacterium lacisalsi AJ5 TaxID=358396 RepID=M0LW98_NATLA|nr:bacteriorhodopsin [Halobiforma lacisalsi]APW97823.1 rhodopsin [Halobiforma lacisalsi AJ5]EMA37428.1 rhodopsin [Halobiforma lacisalsi AJ5]